MIEKTEPLKKKPNFGSLAIDFYNGEYNYLHDKTG